MKRFLLVVGAVATAVTVAFIWLVVVATISGQVISAVIPALGVAVGVFSLLMALLHPKTKV